MGVDAEEVCRQLDERLAELDPSLDDELFDRRDQFVACHTLVAASAGGLIPHVYLLHEGSSLHVTWNSPLSDDTAVVFHLPRGRAKIDAGVFLDSVAEFLS
jgi:hypothetical protein